MESDLQALRVVDLKAILTEHGLDVKGKKDELVSVRAHTFPPPPISRTSLIDGGVAGLRPPPGRKMQPH